MSATTETRSGVVALDVTDVSVRFGSLRALSNITLQAPAEGTVGVIGPNGAGKTTLLATIGGQLMPTSGSVKLFDRDITRLNASSRAGLGLRRTFQSLQLFDEMTVRDNLLVAMSSHTAAAGSRRGRTGAAANIEVTRILNDLDLSRYAYMDAQTLSAPVRRLVSYGRAIVGNPACILLDEPAAGLSDSERDALGTRIRHDVDQGGLSVVVVEHDMGFVRNLCDHIYALDAGVMIASGTFDEVSSDPVVREAYLGPLPESEASTLHQDPPGSG
jgi:branched-chain amino acid transport system ATP-binding protein